MINNKKIFISYRRSDSAGYAGRLYEYLKNYFGNHWIFFDVDTIEIGSRFAEKIKGELENSDAVLVLIGNQWVEIKDANGKRRLDDPEDFVRLEIETTLSRKVPVVPVLLQGARMPPGNALPGTIRHLSDHQAITLNDENWNSDIKNLTRRLKTVLGITRTRREEKMRRLRQWIFVLAIVGAFLSYILSSDFYAGFTPFISLVLRTMYISVLGLCVVFVPYLLGITKRKLDKTGVYIISLPLLALQTSYLGFELFPFLPPLLLMGVPILFNFIEPDE